MIEYVPQGVKLMPQIAIVEHEALVALDIEKTLTRSGYGVAGPYYDAESFLSALPDASLNLVLMDISSDSRISGVTAALESRLRGGTSQRIHNGAP